METYSEIKLLNVPKMRVARYVMISPNPEDDVIAYMDRWAENSGLLNYKGYTPRKIGWDFPFVTKEQTEKFGLRGYVCAYVIPEDFSPACPGAELADIETGMYAAIRVTDPFSNPFEKIPTGYQMLMKHVEALPDKALEWENRVCFEEVIEQGGTTYMDIYVPIK